MIEQLLRIREESEQNLLKLESVSYDQEMQQEIERAKADIMQKYQERKNKELSEIRLEIKALDNIIAREKTKVGQDMLVNF